MPQTPPPSPKNAPTSQACADHSCSTHACATTNAPKTARDIGALLTAAQTLCDQQGVRFTQLRALVYEFVLTAGKPIGAYDILPLLAARYVALDKTDKHGKPVRVAAPTVYRSLGFLLELGLVHELRSISAFVPCCHPRAAHTAAFLICQNCHTVRELSDMPIDALLDFSQNQGFLVQKSTLELSGLCHACR